MTLSDRDRAILDFERAWWTESGPKDVAVRERFDLSSAQYYKVLGGLLDAREAYDYDPLVVLRLRRRRDKRRTSRREGQAVNEPTR